MQLRKKICKEKVEKRPDPIGEIVLKRTLKGRLLIGSVECFAHRPKKKDAYG